MDVWQYSLLLENVKGHRRNTLGKFSETLVFKGSLLETLVDHDELMVPFTDPPHNYRTLVDLSECATLYCHSDQVCQLTTVQKDLLLGVQELHSRLEIVDKLSWAESLEIGSSVFVTLPSDKQVMATVQYIGEVIGINGQIFGLKLKKKEGVSGTIGGVEYFKCNPGCAMFVAIDKLTEIPEKASKSSQTLRRSMSQSINTDEEDVTISKRFSLQPVIEAQLPAFEIAPDKVRHGTLPVGTPPQMKSNLKLQPRPKAMTISESPAPCYEIGNKISFYDKYNRKLSGTLRWIGNNEVDGSKMLGVEADDDVSCEDIPQHIQAVKKECFKLANASHTKLFFPASMLTSNSTMVKQMSSASNYSDDSGTIAKQKKALAFYEHVLVNSDKKKRIQKSKEEIALDDWSTIDESMLDSKLQEKLLNEASQLKQKNKVVCDDVSSLHVINAGTVDDNGHEAVQMCCDHHTDETTSSHSQTQNVSLQTPSSEDCSVTLNEHPWNQQDLANNEITTQLRLNLKIVQDQVEQLQNDKKDQKSIIKNIIDKLHQDVSSMEKRFHDKSHAMMQETADRIQKEKLNIESSLVSSRSYFEEQLASTHNQLSLMQQQLIGLRSVIISSRLLSISHGQFTIGEEIGRGAWATIHKATFRGATVAAKCPHGAITSTTRKLFQREMEMALVCQHQNIVTFLGATMEGDPVILMELMDINLRKAYEQEKVKDHQIHSILHDVAKALHFLHTRPDPVIHRDVSSANVLLKVLYNGEWLAKLGDLGTAKIQQLTATANPGAIVYGAPEASNFSKHSPKMDVYSFGVLIIEILTKTLQFEMVETLKAQAQQQYPQYDQLVTSCTRKQSSDRPTMYDVLVQLDEIGVSD
ncbi:dual specificity protein kinase splB-like isoform X2 [Dysidea avara]|uniref:dual specificity protein kinase splB-like isoform X2 n=1 Tax=Dysidea avara TaxID=196820 RepID=UPI0033216175